MTRILYDTTSDLLMPYPRDDDGPVVGLDPRYLELTVIQEPQPSYDQANEQITPTEVINAPALTVTRGWLTRPATAEEIAAYDEANRPAPDWAAFKSAALTSPALNSVLAQAFATVPVAAAALVPSLLRAEGNGVGDFAVAWSAICRAVPVPPEVITGFQQLATASHLSAEFVAALAGPSQTE